MRLCSNRPDMFKQIMCGDIICCDSLCFNLALNQAGKDHNIYMCVGSVCVFVLTHNSRLNECQVNELGLHNQMNW